MKATVAQSVERLSQDAWNAYIRSYNAKRYAERRALALARLGGRCVSCGAGERLEFDHIDPGTKSFEVMTKWWMALPRWFVEIDKCQLLCHGCHRKKSICDMGRKPAIGTHGTISAYRHCKCALCRAAKAKWQRDYREKRRAHASS